MVIGVDAMGGDNAPRAVVEGCLMALQSGEGFSVQLVGDAARVEGILKEIGYSGGRVEVVHAAQVIGGNDVPTKAIREKKDSSIVVGLNQHKAGKTDVFLSCGNTGALLAGATLITGRIRGVDRPALAPMLPSKTGRAMLIDAGLNSTCKPINYEQFAEIGSIYIKTMYDIESPRVGLLNVGTEANKGTEVVKEAYARLSALEGIHFVGNVESHDLVEGRCDVAVCDGFVGNIFLKCCEAVGGFMKGGLKTVFTKNLKNKLAAAVVLPDMKDFFRLYDNEAYGSTPVLGVDGAVFKGHGNSNAKTVKNAVEAAAALARTEVLARIRAKYAQERRRARAAAKAAQAQAE